MRRRLVWRPLDDAGRELVVNYSPLAAKYAHGFGKSFPYLRDEFLGEAYLALTEAARTYDPGRGVAFATFARFRVVGACFDLLRKERRRGFRPVLIRDLEVYSPESQRRWRGDRQNRWEAVDIEDVIAMVPPGRGRQIVAGVLRDGLSHEDLAERLGLGKSGILRIYNLEIDALRTWLGFKGEFFRVRRRSRTPKLELAAGGCHGPG